MAIGILCNIMPQKRGGRSDIPGFNPASGKPSVKACMHKPIYIRIGKFIFPCGSWIWPCSTPCEKYSINICRKKPKRIKGAALRSSLSNISGSKWITQVDNRKAPLKDRKSLTDSPIDFNYSYKLCSQCHQEQFKDWKGGAHGQQLGGWAPPRVSNTCVNCHNPHNPKFEKRWPVRFNTQVEKERK